MWTSVHPTRPFMATQRGQVSVDPTESLFLISDMHWYWWYVRVCSTGMEGFVPAEVLELPDERLARINRDLNVTITSPVSAPTSKHTPARNYMKKTMRFNDNCLVTYADEEDELIDDSDMLSDGLIMSPSSDDTDSDSADSLSPPSDSILADCCGGKNEAKPLQIRTDDEVDLKHELTVRAL